MLRPFTCEDANRLRYSNDLLDFVIASKLLLNTYQTRAEATPFWHRKAEYEALCVPKLETIPELDGRLRSIIGMSNFGSNRETTSKILSNLSLVSQLAGILVTPIWYLKAPRTILLNVFDPCMLSAKIGRAKFINNYIIFLQQSLGGTWQVHPWKSLSSPNFIRQLFMCAKIILKYPLPPLLYYQRRLTRLCYNYGLKCWWATDFIFANDKAGWFKPMRSEGNSTQADLDGLLGSVFSRSVHVQTNSSDTTEPWSDKLIKEWQVFAMSEKETVQEFGANNTEIIDNILNHWGYRLNRTWKQRNFDMLFDRIFLHLSIQDIAKKYAWEDNFGKTSLHKNTVQKITSELAKLLDLPLPRAEYKKR